MKDEVSGNRVVRIPSIGRFFGGYLSLLLRAPPMTFLPAGNRRQPTVDGNTVVMNDVESTSLECWFVRNVCATEGARCC